MCGIFLSAYFTPSTFDEPAFDALSVLLQQVNSARGNVPSCPQELSSRCLSISAGPDARGSHTLSLRAASPPPSTACDHDVTPSTRQDETPRSLNLVFCGSELRLRGDSPILQPHVRDGNILCWNGEIFEGMEISIHENDGVKLFNALCSSETPEGVRDIFASIEGPYAFVFYHALTSRLYFARDPLGRRSLLIHTPTPQHPYLLLASVSGGANNAYNFSEVSTETIFSIDILSLKDSVEIVQGFNQNLTRISRIPQEFRSPSHFAKRIEVNTSVPIDVCPAISSLDEIPPYLATSVDALITLLDKSVWLQTRDIPSSLIPGKSRLGVLFSGGIDSAIITYLANRHIPLDEPIDLLNVAFENPHKIKNQNLGNTGGIPKRVQKAQAHRNEVTTEQTPVSYRVPDRVTGLTELEELRRLCPGRTWNFVEVNIPYAECQLARPLVESIMAPCRTVMDLSLALALYFASRGQGQIRVTPDSLPVPYESTARVLLNGFGSDELLGGYGRHRSVYNNGGWAAIVTELQAEIDRIPMRNLGRDDRIISSHGKEARHPFVSLSVVSFLASLPVNYKMDLRLEAGAGDKMLLRLAARKLGLMEASSRKKRAMQFGSHSARMNGERRGDVDLE